MNPAKGTVLRFKPRGSALAPTGNSPYHLNNISIDFSVIVDLSLKFHDSIKRNSRSAGGNATNMVSSILLGL